jgi:hypothetical protein
MQEGRPWLRLGVLVGTVCWTVGLSGLTWMVAASYGSVVNCVHDSHAGREFCFSRGRLCVSYYAVSPAPEHHFECTTMSSSVAAKSPTHVIPLLPIVFLIAIGGTAVLGKGIYVCVRSERRARRGFCVHCGYDLRDLTEARCPECGEPSPDAAD